MRRFVTGWVVSVLALAAGWTGSGPRHALAQAGAAQPLGVVLDGVITADAFKEMRASGQAARNDKGEGFVYVEASPASAEVSVAGRRSQTPPFTLERIPAGYQPVVIDAQGYSRIEGYVLVEPLKVARIRVVLPPKDGDLTILSEPTGARVLVDGQAVGVAPLTIERLAGGEHQVMLTADGGLVWQGTVMIAGGVEVLRPTLKPSGDQALATAAPVLPAAPVVRPMAPAAPSVMAPAPAAPPAVVPVATAARPTAPAAPAAPSAGEIDLSGLSPELRGMAWQKLSGKHVEITLGTGQSTVVDVGDVRGDNVILKDQSGTARLVPMSHITKVKE